jgi:hypothetical protein
LKNWREQLKEAGINGPWEGEPDHQEWRYDGVPCVVNRNDHGSWCGYVAIPPGHPLYEKDVDVDDVVEAHGGITYSEHGCMGEICHTPRPGESDYPRWVGFDCAHCMDFVPTMALLRSQLGYEETAMSMLGRFEVYRTIDYVKAETENLAQQIAALARPEAWTEKLQEVQKRDSDWADKRFPPTTEASCTQKR